MKKIYFLPLLLLATFTQAQNIRNGTIVSSIPSTNAPFPIKNAQGKLQKPSSFGNFSGKMQLFNSTGKIVPATVCSFEKGDAHSYIGPPQTYVQQMEQLAKQTQAKSTFIVNYHNFTTAAQQSFQRAVDIWSSLVSTSIPVRIEAYYTPLATRVLGRATPADFSNNFPGVQRADTWYPMALAEKIAAQDLNGIQSPDIVARFTSASNINWYFSTGSETSSPDGTYDFTSIVLHELCHGLGFTSSFDGSASDGTASWGNNGYPFVYDWYVVNASGQVLMDTSKFANNSTTLKAQLTSNAVYLNNPRSLAKGVTPRLYAPRTWGSGSSISHLNDATYPAGDINSLMTSTASPTEINNNPGPIVLDFFADMGWKGTSLVHQNQKSIETRPNTVTLKATITSDTTLVANSMQVTYAANGNPTSTVSLVKNGTSNDYYATIPISPTDTTIYYYLSVKDAFGTTNTNPPQAPNYYWSFNVGVKDTTAPVLEFYPINLARTTDPLVFIADAEDDFAAGVDSVYMQYSLNGAAIQTIGLSKLDITKYPQLSRGRRDPYTYILINPFTNLKSGDRITYRVLATDKSAKKNLASLPNDGTYFTLVIANPKNSVVTQYSNDFENATTANADFAGVGFAISTPSGFTSSIQSDHPYTNGTGYGFETYRIMELLQPFVVSASTPTLSFDEVVLVEPNEADGTYQGGESSGFYDYVIVQGSNDGGNTWSDLLDGYNCRASGDWLAAWNKNSAKDTKNSTATQLIYDSTTPGTAALMHNRQINLTDGYSGFAAGDTLLIRFVLFSDQLVHGWGWAIDNLKIQVPPVTAVTPVVDNKLDLTVFPNPSPDILQVKANLKQAGKVQMEVLNTTGVRLFQQNFTADSQTFTQSFDLKNYPAGTYFIRMYANDATLMKKFVVVK